MNRHLTTSILLTLAAFQLEGQTKSYFPNLTTVTIDKNHQVYFGYERNSTRLINTVCYQLDKNDPFYCPDSSYFEGRIVAKFKCPGIKDSLTILFDPGMSDDPEFSVVSKNQKVLGRVAALEFYVNSAGVVYSAGHANNMYNRKRKFQINKDTMLEIKQPYNYVGLKGKTLKDIVLYQNKDAGDAVVAKLPKGYDIEVLLTESSTKDYETDRFYLVKTDFGLVGWLRLTDEDIFGAVMEGLFFNGD